MNNILSKEDIHNIIVFLERTQLTGSEAIAYVTIIEKLKTMQKTTQQLKNNGIKSDNHEECN